MDFQSMRMQHRNRQESPHFSAEHTTPAKTAEAALIAVIF
jgi:hypothetical protein